MPLPGSPVTGGFGFPIGGASASAGPIAGTLGAVNSGRTFISGLALWPLAALVLFSGIIRKTRITASTRQNEMDDGGIPPLHLHDPLPRPHGRVWARNQCPIVDVDYATIIRPFDSSYGGVTDN